MTTLRGRSLVGVSGVVWLTLGLAQVVQSYVLASAAHRPWTLTGALITGMPWWLSWFLLTPMIASLAARFTFSAGSTWRSLGTHVVAGIALSAIHLTVTGTVHWVSTGRELGVATSLVNQVQRFFGSFFLEAVVTYGAAAGVLIAIDFARAVRDKEVSRARLAKEAAELQTSLTQARLDALRMELNPHFLFNTLTAISGLVSQDRKLEAREVISRLAELLRRSLDGGQTHYATLGEELLMLEDYLFIQRLRFGDRLAVHIDVDEGSRDCLVPSMLLLQLVENAVRHGIEPREGKGSLVIEAERAGTSVRIAIRDTGAGFPLNVTNKLTREGIGISNSRARLAHLYGDRAALQLRNGHHGGAEAIVLIPLRSAEHPAAGTTFQFAS